MTTNSQTLAEALKNLEGQVVESYVDGWKSYWKLVTDVARDPSSLPSAQKEYLTHIAETAPDRISKTLQAGVQVYGALIQSGGRLASELYTQTAQDLREAASVADKAAAATTNGSQAAPVAPSEFRFEGFAEETLGRRFLVSNKSAQAVVVALEVTGFVPDPGDGALQMELVPQTFSLGAGEEKVVECGVTIAASLPPNVEFRAVLSAPGVPLLKIVLSVTSLGAREFLIEDAAPV